MQRVTIVGAGYVGICTGLALAEQGHRITVVDVSASRVTQIARGEAPFFEPGVEELLERHAASGAFRATSDLAASARDSDLVFLCVGTPSRPDGSVDLTFVDAAARQIGAALQGVPKPPVIIIKSTVPPGTARDIVRPALGNGEILLASNPEFLREGSAMMDARHPDRIVVGADDPSAAARVWALYENNLCPKVTVDTSTAEMIKYAANAFLAAKVALSNELANVAERKGIDWYKVAQGIGLDARIGPPFMRAGAGFGGSCFPKDVAGLAHAAREAGVPSLILDAVLRGNDLQPLVAVRMLRQELGSLTGKRIAILGLAFKPDTDDVRETRALPIYDALCKEGADVILHDPQAAVNFARLSTGAAFAASPEEALRGADGCIMQTEWAVYRALRPSHIAQLMRNPVVIDGRRTFDATEMRAAGVRYRAIGLGATEMNDIHAGKGKQD
jgi:UDPglucose 6-dehydrogenase